MKATYKKYILNFRRPSGTSRGVMTQKETWFIILQENGRKGIGECGLLRGLSYDDRPDYEEKLAWVCKNIDLGQETLLGQLAEFPSIQFGIETAFLSLQAETPFNLFPSEFTAGTKSIPINGLVWMGDKEFMIDQIREKTASGFRCIKMKIGAIEFDRELEILGFIRGNFNAEEIEIRVDANGAFTSEEALYKLNQLSGFQIHSIEQPIAKNQHDRMSELCFSSPIPIALDEELIAVTNQADKEKLLQKIGPQYIILKPTLIGGIQGCDEWITLAEENKIGWWITSALESNIGLNAIAQYTFTKKNPMPQGLGTGSLYTNNFESPLEVGDGHLWYRPERNWDINPLEF